MRGADLPAATVAGRASGRTRLSAGRGLSAGARVERAPFALRAPVRALDGRSRRRRPRRVVVAAGAHRRGRFYLAPPGSEQEAPALSVTPLIAGKRGRRGSGDYAGVDGDVQTDGFDVATAPVAPARPYPFPPVAIGSDAIRVAVVDVSFDKLAALPSAVEGTDARRFARRRRTHLESAAAGDRARSRHGDGGRRAGGVSGRARRPVPDSGGGRGRPAVPGAG